MFQQVEFDIGDRHYRAEKLDVFQQFDVARKLAPVIAGAMDLVALVLRGVGGTLMGTTDASQEELDKRWQETRSNIQRLFQTNVTEIAGPFAKALAAMPDADSRFIMTTCLSKVSVQQGGVWVPLMAPGGVIAFQDIELPHILRIAWQIIQVNLAPFSRGPLGGSASAGQK